MFGGQEHTGMSPPHLIREWPSNNAGGDNEVSELRERVAYLEMVIAMIMRARGNPNGDLLLPNGWVHNKTPWFLSSHR